MDHTSTVHPEVAGSLMLAMIGSSHAPLLLLDGGLKVVAASDSFCHIFQLDPAAMAGQALDTLGSGEWGEPQLAVRLRATAAGGAPLVSYEFGLDRRGGKPRQLVLNAQKLDYADNDNVRLMLAAADVTDARLSEKLKEDLLRDKNILLQELQHRVANSLQIIASVLMQSARRVQSEETRGHLHDAHNRVMSIAALQQQLATSTLDQVELRAYFTDLCRSIGTSMIRDHNQLSIEVSTDDASAAADLSVSLGLIVTELVINALKHAFPEQRPGIIKVGYASQGDDWSLSVTDDGIGMPGVAAPPLTGLGTSIIEALARKLSATVVISDADPGTKVTIAHQDDVALESPAPLAA
ncbi:MAG TPA: histidine kinase dimerization/phosphoacceptor domain -containing protein [Sphingomonas sp.]|uniref:sensor histidine kinase n=1 Tax=Sphingomonas sp. TaxID=28214 RepID=UPI002B9D5E18|nr:histidine kinase dimerization/phosphoacceptor domain -containing protein [Sphingomonas sp.]HMI19221.1 histidine kinase dimerization/phosphoacceptor domain -containing protein [Sphingomonas sp.]